MALNLDQTPRSVAVIKKALKQFLIEEPFHAGHVTRGKFFLRRKLILSTLIFLLLPGLVDLAGGSRAQQLEPIRTASARSKTRRIVRSNASAQKSSNRLSLIERIIWLPKRILSVPIQLGRFSKDVAELVFHHAPSTAPKALRGKFVAYDQFQGLTDPRQPLQRFVVEAQKGESVEEVRLLRLVYFAEGTSIRGGAKFLGDHTLSYSNTWTMRVHRPSKENERAACDKIDNFFRTSDGSPSTDETGQPILRFRSTRSSEEVKFDGLSAMPCLVLDSLVAGPEPRLIEVGTDYVLKVAFDNLGQVSNAIIVPKYYGEACEPAWTEPNYRVRLNQEESTSALSKVNKFRDFGQLVSEGKVGDATNAKVWLLDQYQSAFVRRLVNVTLGDTSPSGNSTQSLAIHFIRPVAGEIKDKKAIDRVGIDKEYRVNIDDYWYLTTKSEFERSEIGASTLINAGGPIDGLSLCRQMSLWQLPREGAGSDPAFPSSQSSQETIQIHEVIESKSLSGIVFGPNDKPLAEALVERITPNQEKQIESVVTGPQGDFNFKRPATGVHFLRVSKAGFNVLLMKVMVTSKAPTNLEVSLGLRH